MRSVSVYTEAACSENTRKGGFAAVILQPNGVFEIAGRACDTTLNAMRITAAVEALDAVPASSQVKVFSRSKYLVRAVTLGWLKKWSASGWKMGKGADVENVPSWQRLLEAVARHERVTFAWLRHPASTAYNEHARTLAWDTLSTDPFDPRECTLGKRRGGSQTGAITSVIF